MKLDYEKNEILKWSVIILIVVLIYKFVERQRLIDVIYQSLPQTEAGLMAGIVVGDKSGFDKVFYEQLKNSGLVHLVVVSGSNVMLLVGGLIENLAQFLGRKKTIAGGLVIGWGYAGMVAWEVPVVRAMLLVSIFYLSQLLGRKYNLWRSLILAVGIMVLADVLVLTSVSFWLSITAFLGVITVKSKWWANMSVMAWTVPVLAMVFGKISLISPITNLLVVGMVEVITVLGMIGSAAGIKEILWLALPWLKYLAVVVNWGGSDWLVGKISFNWLILIGWYLILFWWLKKRYEKNKNLVGN